MGSWRLRGAVTAVLLFLAALAPAQASAAVGAPITIGVGDSPNVTVEDDGTAHVAWRGPGVDSKVLHYCRLPRGATACSPATIVPAPGDSVSLPFAFGQGSTVRVLSFRYGLSGPAFSAMMLFTSTDGGASFDTGVVVGTIDGADFAFGPGDVVSGITSANQCGTCFQAFPLSGGAGGGPAVLSTDHPYAGTIALFDPATPVAVFATGGGDAQVRRYTGSGDVNDAANWTPPVDIGALDVPQLASGPSGLFMAAVETLSGHMLQVRKYDGNTFGARVTVADGVRDDDLAQDGLGRLHTIGGKFTAGPTGAGFFYASSDNGTVWDTDEVQFPGVPGNMRLAIASDHFGWAAGRYATGASGSIFAAPMGPSAAVPTTGKFVDVAVVSGTVLIQVPPSKKFIPLRTGDVIPVGSVVDATKGRVRITIQVPGGKLQATDFFQGAFKVAQAKNGLATMALSGGSFARCPRGARAGAVDAKAKVIRQLWGNGSGKFRTKGRYATASIRGTTWDTIDRCDGTLIRVTKGRILVNDLKKHKNVTLKAGQSYLAKA